MTQMFMCLDEVEKHRRVFNYLETQMIRMFRKQFLTDQSMSHFPISIPGRPINAGLESTGAFASLAAADLPVPIALALLNLVIVLDKIATTPISW